MKAGSLLIDKHPSFTSVVTRYRHNAHLYLVLELRLGLLINN